MTDLSAADLIDIFRTVAAAINDERDRLSELDGVIGDADHGVTMSIGFDAVVAALGALDAAAADPTLVFNTAAKSFLNAVGASSGPLYATAFMRAGAAVRGKPELSREDVVAVIAAMARGIQERGKGERGEKTMLDAWLPAADAAAAAPAEGGISGCLVAAAEAARQGAEATKAMIATKGRSSRLGERALGHIDPGAASAVVILDAMAQAADGRAVA